MCFADPTTWPQSQRRRRGASGRLRALKERRAPSHRAGPLSSPVGRRVTPSGGAHRYERRHRRAPPQDRDQGGPGRRAGIRRRGFAFRGSSCRAPSSRRYVLAASRGAVWDRKPPRTCPRPGSRACSASSPSPRLTSRGRRPTTWSRVASSGTRPRRQVVSRRSNGDVDAMTARAIAGALRGVRRRAMQVGRPHDRSAGNRARLGNEQRSDPYALLDARRATGCHKPGLPIWNHLSGCSDRFLRTPAGALSPPQEEAGRDEDAFVVISCDNDLLLLVRHFCTLSGRPRREHRRLALPGDLRGGRRRDRRRTRGSGGRWRLGHRGHGGGPRSADDCA